MFREIIQNPLGIFLALLSIVLGFILWKKGKINKQLCCYKSYFHLVGGEKKKFEKVNISYDGKTVDDITVTNYTIWNCGNSVINNVDMADGRNVKINSNDDAEILDAQILVSSDESNKVECQVLNGKEVNVDFSYLSEREGFVIQIVHSKSSEALSVDYKIKGGKPLKFFKDKSEFLKTLFDPFSFLRKKSAPPFFRNLIPFVIALLLMCLAVFFTVCWANPDVAKILEPKQKADSSSDVIAVCVGMWFYTIFWTWAFLPQLKDLFNMGIPRKLKKFSSFN
jgi:hypothetical protein